MATETQKKPKTLQELYEERAKLYNDLYTQQQSAAQQAKQNSLNALDNQLAQQRQAYTEGMGVLSEQGYNRGRHLLNNLANRGLNTSGLMQLGDLQTKLATGQSVSNLATSYKQMQDAATQQRQNIEQGHFNNLRQLDYDLKANLLSNDENYLNRQLETGQRTQEVINSLIEMKAQGVDDAIIAKLIASYEANLGLDLSGESQNVDDLLSVVKTPEQIAEEEERRKDYLDSKIKWSPDYSNWRQWTLNSQIGAGWVPEIGVWSIGTHKTKMGKDETVDDFAKRMKELYKGFDHYDDIDIVYVKDKSQGNRFKFATKDGKKFDTWNQAIKYLEGRL